MPKIKSSNSIFSHKSKFRFSGRCESELIASQNHSQNAFSNNSIISVSPLSVTVNNDASNALIPNHSLNNAGSDGTFKRQVFINIS